MCCWPVFLTLFFCGFVFFARKKAWAVDEIPMDLVSSYNSSRGDINIITKSLHHHSNLQTMIDLSCPSRAVHSDLLGSISAVHFAISVGPSRPSIPVLVATHLAFTSGAVFSSSNSNVDITNFLLFGCDIQTAPEYINDHIGPITIKKTKDGIECSCIFSQRLTL